jgi:hypothetical protein
MKVYDRRPEPGRRKGLLAFYDAKAAYLHRQSGTHVGKIVISL